MPDKLLEQLYVYLLADIEYESTVKKTVWQ